MLESVRLKNLDAHPELRRAKCFKAKITTAAEKESFEDWRQGMHDDLVLAVALAAWQGERTPTGPGARPYAILPAWAGREM